MTTPIIVTMLSGGNRENEICDAVRSVLFVDHICLVDTGDSAPRNVLSEQVKLCGGKVDWG